MNIIRTLYCSRFVDDFSIVGGGGGGTLSDSILKLFLWVLWKHFLLQSYFSKLSAIIVKLEH